jgi:hypothetical protein
MKSMQNSQLLFRLPTEPRRRITGVEEVEDPDQFVDIDLAPSPIASPRAAEEDPRQDAKSGATSSCSSIEVINVPATPMPEQTLSAQMLDQLRALRLKFTRFMG